MILETVQLPGESIPEVYLLMVIEDGDYVEKIKLLLKLTLIKQL